MGSGVSWPDCYHADLGDGVLLLVPAEYPKAVFSELLPVALTAFLAEHNRVHRLPERIRLRAVLHAGEVSYDAYGRTGSAIVHTFRLLHSSVVRDAPANAGGDLAVIASAWIFEEIIRHSPVSRPERYRPVFVQEKETEAWSGSGCWGPRRAMLGWMAPRREMGAPKRPSSVPLVRAALISLRRQVHASVDNWITGDVHLRSLLSRTMVVPFPGDF